MSETIKRAAAAAAAATSPAASAAKGPQPTTATASHPHPKPKHPDTLAVHGGRPPPVPGAMLNAPIVLNSTYRAGTDLVYGRYGNESWDAFESVIGELEGGQAVAFPSGTAAVAAVFDQVPVGGVVVTAKPVYQGTWAQLEERQAGGRIKIRYVDTTDAAAVAAASKGAALIWIETPCNPTLDISDIAAIAKGRDPGSILAVDSTFASPLLQRPLKLGADFVVHSATKVIGGHADLLMGVAVAADPERAAALHKHRSTYGATPGALEVFLALRGARTLSVRLERAQSNALKIARFLAAHPKVAAVRYPGLPDDPGHKVAAKQMQGARCGWLLGGCVVVVRGAWWCRFGLLAVIWVGVAGCG